MSRYNEILTMKLSKWLDKNIPHYFSNKGDLIEIIEIIAEATIPIRGLLERGITSREIEQRMNIENVKEKTINVYGESQIHEDILTHSIILKTLQVSDLTIMKIIGKDFIPDPDQEAKNIQEEKAKVAKETLRLLQGGSEDTE